MGGGEEWEGRRESVSVTNISWLECAETQCARKP